MLPAGLSWSDTATDVLNKLGQPDQSYTAGYGVEAFFTYSNWNGRTLRINLVARHQQELPNSPMHTIVSIRYPVPG